MPGWPLNYWLDNNISTVRTAGMRTLRLVDPYTTSWIMGNLTRALDRLTGHNTDSSVVTGEMEVDLDHRVC